MKEGRFEIKGNRMISDGVYEMVLEGPSCEGIRPGQFINLALPGFTLRRPISVCDAEGNRVTILYKAAGAGTELMTGMKEGNLSVLYELGNGFDLADAGERPLLAGGGIGLAPMYMLAKELVNAGKKVTVAAGFRSSSEIFYIEKFKAIGAEVIIATADGSEGTKGFVTDILGGDYTYLYTCGPKAMLKAVYDKTQIDGQYSFEERMGCGFGACMGCTCNTKEGFKRVCKEGPVFRKEVILWED